MPDETSDASPSFLPRPPAFVMSTARAEAAVPSALSFTRSAMRRLVRGRYAVEKLRFELDHEGRGEVLYRLVGEGWQFHFFLISQKLDEAMKTDRNFAQSWDAMGVLCQGEWTPQREALLRREVPKQRAGFADYDTLIYARGNRSARLFDHVVERLAAGRQPDATLLAPVGYILRTTAFIGNGQLGTRPLEGYEPDHPFRHPYHAQFASAFVLREYVYDLVDHLARCRNPDAASLAPEFRRYLGLGNAAATGLVPFVVNHPHLFQRWCTVYEWALAAAMERVVARDDDRRAGFDALLDKAIRYSAEGARPDDGVFAPARTLVADLERVKSAFEPLAQATRPWAALAEWARENVGREACETLDAIVLELHPDIVDAATDHFYADERFRFDPQMRLFALSELLHDGYAWALEGRDDAEAQPHFWYRTTKAPRDVRRGLRGRVAAFEFESTIDTVRDLRRLACALTSPPPALTVGEFVSARPDLRHIVTRVQTLCGLAYSELHADWLARDFSPFGPVRFVLSFFGLEKFEAAMPKSVRGTFMQGAPIAEDVAAGRDGDWPFPLMPSSTTHERRRPVDTERRSVLVTCGPPASDDELVLAPRELARMVQNAVQGHGLPLGVAAIAADLVVFAQAFDRRALDVVLAHCRGHAFGRGAPLPAVTSAAGVTIDAGGCSALRAATDAMDRALIRSGVVQVRNCLDAWLLAALPLRVAEQRHFGLLVWRDSAQDTPDQDRFALAGPGVDGPWYARGRLSDAPMLVAMLDGSLASAADFALICTEPGSALSRVATDGLAGLLHASRAPTLDAMNSRQLAARYDAWRRRGVSLTRAQFDALAKAGEAVLVPVDDEHRILAEGMDPLKVF